MTAEELETLPIGTLFYRVDENSGTDPLMSVLALGSLCSEGSKTVRALIDLDACMLKNLTVQTVSVTADDSQLGRYHSSKRAAAESWIQTNVDYAKELDAMTKFAREQWCDNE